MSNVVPSLCSVALINMEKAFQACFEKLTEETNEIGSLLKLRLVNQLFNGESLRKLRILHKEIIIEVNHHAFAVENMNRRYNIFLNETVQVKVHKLKLKNVYRFGGALQQVIHHAIVNVLVGRNNRDRLVEVTGMEDVCMSGCEDCTSLIKKCNVCGPIQWHALTRLKQNEKYDTLIVSDNLLTLIAEHAMMETFLNGDVRTNVDKIVPPLQCTNLVLVVTDDFSDPDFTHLVSIDGTTTPQGIPLVILNEVLKKWTPKKITLEAHASRPTGYSSSYNYQEGFDHTLFTSSSDRIQQNQNQMFDHVTVDLTFAGVFVDDFIRHNRERNLIPNVLKMFPTKKMTIIFPRGFGNVQNMVYPNFFLC
ncbi:hypothetical protein GCK72_025959 [Caenorhabditis remanei]|uniref:Uncharacterized protein n=1 Tax=Caenorhabditis remanei TaxID=31234 RepID=A0A6A5G443_CAERE|nr:hypothetical protein GCK72_025959 [Caenorhabditis remanei]KAF1749491.1 hypothetical protein GCK72_025959 [Caenorhabditis remanei]